MTSVACSLLSLCVYLKEPKRTEVCTTPTVFRDQMNDTASLTNLTAAKSGKARANIPGPSNMSPKATPGTPSTPKAKTIQLAAAGPSHEVRKPVEKRAPLGAVTSPHIK